MSEPAIKIYVDSREKLKIQDAEIKSLPLGDIYITRLDEEFKNSQDKYTEVPLCLIERKTYQDLASSIIDGRYREQRKRLIEFRDNNPQVVIMYVIEGYGNKGNRGRINVGCQKAIRTALQNLAILYNISVLPSLDVEETTNHVVELADKFRQNLSVPNGKQIIGAGVLPSKKKISTGSDLFKSQLCVIPSVGNTMAHYISLRYKNFIDLYKDYSENGINNLKNIQCGHRKLGTKVASTICRLLFN